MRRTKTFKEKIFDIVNNENFDPYNGTDKIVFLVRKIIKDRIKEIEKAKIEAEERGDLETARLYRDIIYPMNWMLDQKFDYIKKRTEEYYP